MNLGWRLGALALTFAALFGVLALKMWTIQVTATSTFVEAAESNLVKFVDTPAPRGQIRDINGNLLADNRNARVAVIEGALVSREGEERLVHNLAAFSGRSASEIEELVDEARRRGDRIELPGEGRQRADSCSRISTRD